MGFSGTVELTTQLGLDEASVRTAVSRLKKRGWLVSETRAGVRGYALSTVALAELAAGDEVIWHARQPADLADGWCLVTFSALETARARRDRLSLVARCWDLTAIDERYRAFIKHFAGVDAGAGEGSPIAPAAAFATYVSLVDEWRLLPFRDPGLPPPGRPVCRLADTFRQPTLVVRWSSGR